MTAWKLEDIDRPPFKPHRLTLTLNPEEPWAGIAVRRAHAMGEERFAAAIVGCPELAAYRNRAGQDQEMRDTLARVELEIREVDLGMAVAKADLSGERLAKRLADLDRKRKTAEARIGDLEHGIKLFIGDVERDRQAAEAALARIANEVGKEVYQAARKEMEQAKAALVAAIAPHMDAIAELMQAVHTTMDGQYGNLIDDALNGTLSAVEAPSPPETVPTARKTENGKAKAAKPSASGGPASDKDSIDKDTPPEAPPPEAPPPSDEAPPPSSPATERNFTLAT